MSDLKPVVVKKLSPVVNGTRTIHLDTHFAFKPGQAVKVQFPGDVKARYFSLSSSPTETGSIAITVKAEAGSPLAESLKSLAVGSSTLEVNGPWGSFGLPEAPPKAFCFLAGGTGVTPFRSMIKFLLDGKSSAELRLFHSVRQEADLLFHEEFKTWTSPQFVYTPIITGQSQTWKGAQGRMNVAHLKAGLPAVSPVTFFLCGPPAFVGDIETLLKESLHVTPEHIRREQW